MNSTPAILFIGGHDPVGGAGLQADLETACALGCRAYSLVTCLTTQDSRNVYAVHPQPPAQLDDQLQRLLADVRPDLIKVGLIGDAALARLLADRLGDLGLPLVLDPVLAAGGGHPLAGEELLQALRRQWLPLVTLLTPNRGEARRLTDRPDIDAAAQALLDAGCDRVLITGADETDGDRVCNSLYSASGRSDANWPRLPHQYHGSGCTLAAACACHLAQGMPPNEAVQAGQAFAWQALRHAENPGGGQYLPTRWRTP
jgi:hydroxymethylpyrimidine/phosphomethylpyrimidine kinase